jgi:hypothetical protein
LGLPDNPVFGTNNRTIVYVLLLKRMFCASAFILIGQACGVLCAEGCVHRGEAGHGLDRRHRNPLSEPGEIKGRG